MSRHDDRRTCGRKLRETAPEGAAGREVGARGRLVKKEDLRMVKKRAGDRQIALRTHGQRLGRHAPVGRKPVAAHRLGDAAVDEKTKDQVAPKYRPITSEYLDYDEVMERYDQMMEWLADLYVNTLNLIQYMHDKYYYEAAQMSLIDTDLKRTFATGIAGFSHVVDSLSAIKYAKVKTIRDEDGVVVDYEVEGDFPRYGNDDDRADDIAVWLLGEFLAKIKKHHTYRDSEPTTSILTITSNVVYGKAIIF